MMNESKGVNDMGEAINWNSFLDVEEEILCDGIAVYNVETILECHLYDDNAAAVELQSYWPQITIEMAGLIVDRARELMADLREDEIL